MKNIFTGITVNFFRKVWSTYQLAIRNLIKLQDHFNLVPSPNLATRSPSRFRKTDPSHIIITFLSSPQNSLKYNIETFPCCELIQFIENQTKKQQATPPKNQSLQTYKQAQGDWIVYLQSDEIPTPGLVDALSQVPVDTEIVYWDILYTQNSQVKPWYKPGWSPELLFSAPLLCGSAIRKESLLKIASEIFEEGEVSWQELLILVLKQKNLKFLHIPKFFSKLQSAIPIQHYLPTAEALVRASIHPKTTSVFDAYNAIKHQWPLENQSVSIIIPTRNNFPVVWRCVTTLLEITHYHNFNVILIDDHSDDPELFAWYAELSKHPQVRIIKNSEEFNYSKVNNLGAQSSDGQLLLFLNNDTEIIESDWLEEMVRWAQLPEIGVVGAQLFYPNGTIQHNGIVIGLGGHAGHIFQGLPSNSNTIFGSTNWIRNISAVTGACMMMRRSVFDEVHGFDEGLKIVFNDVDICLKVIKKGYRNLVIPCARLIHYEGLSRDKALPPQDVEIGTSKLLPLVKLGDPYFSPRLSHAVNYPTPHRWFEPDPVRRLKRIDFFLSRK